ncbi:MAG: hypothetical protein KAR39_06980 [Thermoplasmata archaeon]|nr:hypothetical protein [Thermoplasmata archaeon]
MWLARKKAKKKPRKKRRNAKARYDKECPVVPIRLPKSFKKQLAKEAEKKDLMISQYIRDLLQGFEIRERIVEIVVEKPVVETVFKTICDPKKEEEIESLKQIVMRLEDELLSREGELAEASKANSRQQEDIASLRESHHSLSSRYEALMVEHEIMGQGSEGKQKEIDGLKKSVSSITAQHATLTQEHQQTKQRVRKLLEDNSEQSMENARLKRQLEWALNELKYIDARNEALARKVAHDHDIEVRIVRTSWQKMPKE